MYLIYKSLLLKGKGAISLKHIDEESDKVVVALSQRQNCMRTKYRVEQKVYEEQSLARIYE